MSELLKWILGTGLGIVLAGMTLGFTVGQRVEAVEQRVTANERRNVEQDTRLHRSDEVLVELREFRSEVRARLLAIERQTKR